MRFFPIQEIVEGVQLLVPEFLVIGEPLLRFLHGRSVYPNHLKASFFLAVDQARVFEHLQMLRYGG